VKIGFGKKKKKSKKMSIRPKRVKPLFYEDLTISDESLILMETNMPEIKVPIVNDPKRLMNGIYFLVYGLYVDVNKVDDSIKTIKGNVKTIANLLRVVAPVDIFVFNSGEIENKKLKILLVFRFKFVRATEYGIEPIPDVIILRKLVPSIKEKINDMVRNTFLAYEPVRLPITSLTSKQLRVVGFPPRRTYVIYDKVKDFENILADYMLSVPISSFEEHYEVSSSETVSGKEEEVVEHIERTRTHPVPISQPKIGPGESVIPPTRREGGIQSIRGREHSVESGQMERVSEVIPIDEGISVGAQQPLVQQEFQKQPSIPMQQPTGEPQSRIGNVIKKPEQSFEQPILTYGKPESVSVEEQQNVVENVEYNVQIKQSESVQQTQPMYVDECDKILSDFVEEQCGDVSVIYNNSGNSFYRDSHLIIRSDKMFVDVVYGFVDMIKSMLGCGHYDELISSVNTITYEIDRVVAEFLGLDDVLNESATNESYNLINIKDFYRGLYNIVTGKPFNKGTLVRLLPIGVTPWGEKYYYITEYLPEPQRYPTWQAVSNRVTLIIGGMGSGKSHLGKYILELNALAGGSSILVVTTTTDLNEYSNLKKKLDEIRDKMKKCGCDPNDPNVIECVDGCSSLSDYEKKLIKKVGIHNLRIQLTTIAPIAKSEDMKQYNFDFVFTLPVNLLTFGIIRSLISGVKKKQEFVLLNKAFEMGIKGFYEFLLNLYKKNPEVIRHPLQFIGINPEIIGDKIPHDPDGEDDIPSFYMFVKALKLAPAVDKTIENNFLKLLKMDYRAEETFKRVFADIRALKDKNREFLQMFKGTTEPIVELGTFESEPVPAKSTFSKEFVYEHMFKPHTLTVIYLPMEKEEVYKKVGIIMFNEIMKILQTIEGFRREQIRRNEPITPILIGIDEAHFYFNRSNYEDVVDEGEYLNSIEVIARTSRKYSYGIILMSQLASDIPKNVFRNAGVKFIGRLNSNDSIKNETSNQKLGEIITNKLPKKWFIVSDSDIPGGYFLVSATIRLSDIISNDESLRYDGPSEEIAEKIKSFMNNLPDTLREKLKVYLCNVKKGRVVEIPLIKIE